MEGETQLQLTSKSTRYPCRPSGAALPAHRVTSLRSSRLVRGLANHKIVPRSQFPTGHRGKREVGHAEPHLDRLQSLVRIQLPYNSTVLAKAVRHAATAAILAATTASLSFAGSLPSPCRGIRRSGSLATSGCGRSPTSPRSGPNPPRRGSSRILLDPVFRVKRLALAIRQIRLESQRPVGNLDDVVGPRHGNRHVSGHPRKQPYIRVVELNCGVVRHHILNRRRVHAHL